MSYTPAQAGGATASNQDEQTTHLGAIETAAEGSQDSLENIESAVVAGDSTAGVNDPGIPFFAERRDADTSPATATGKLHRLLTTALGYLKVSVKEIVNVTLAAGANVIGAVTQSGNWNVGGFTKIVSGSITRPGDTIDYASGDAVTNSTTSPTAASIANCVRVNNGSGSILSASLNDSANQPLKGDFDVFISTSPLTVNNDNTAFTPTDAEMLTVVGVIPFLAANAVVGNAASAASGNCRYSAELSNPIPFACTGGGTTLYWSLVSRSARSPVSAEVFTLNLAIRQD